MDGVIAMAIWCLAQCRRAEKGIRAHFGVSALGMDCVLWLSRRLRFPTVSASALTGLCFTLPIQHSSLSTYAITSLRQALYLASGCFPIRAQCRGNLMDPAWMRLEASGTRGGAVAVSFVTIRLVKL